MKNFANLIRIYINKHNLSQAQFAKRANLERGRVNKILLGRKTPNSVELVKLEEFFKDETAT